METWTIIASVLGAVGVICAILFAYLSFSDKKRQNDSESGAKNGTILTELGYIKANTDEIKTEQKEQRKINMDIYTLMAAVETSTKQAHKRLDEFVGHSKDE